MGQLVKPKTFMVGYSRIDYEGLTAYLEETGNRDFLDSVEAAKKKGLSDGEIMCSLYAKICYASLTLGKNANVTRVRDIPDNLVGCFQAGHGSVFGHCNLNFITTRCSRVFTHELVRNHVGTEFSQTSGRYVRLDNVDVIFDDILDGCQDLFAASIRHTEDTVYLIECRKGLRKPPSTDPAYYGIKDRSPGKEFFYTPEQTLDIRDTRSDTPEDWQKAKWVPDDKLDFSFKKKVTSAARRLAPNGQSNEIGWSINLRALRHVIQMRTSRHAEWEIRYVMNQVYDLVKTRFPMIFWGAKIKIFEGLPEVYGMKTQPYALTEDEVLAACTVDELRNAIAAKEGGQ